MSANAQPILPAFWSYEEPTIDDNMRTILTEYSGIPEAQLVQHVKDVRNRAWEVFKYPCIGLFAFLKVRLADSPLYPTIIDRLRSGESLLELGCGLGQEIRRMVVDGAPSENISGADLQQPFIEYGYGLFNDRATLK